MNDFGEMLLIGETHSELGGRKEYVCLLHPPTARGADLKSHGCSGGDTDAKPTLLEGAWEHKAATWLHALCRSL